MYIETINSPEDVKKIDDRGASGTGRRDAQCTFDQGKPAWRTFRTKFRNGGSDHCHALCI